MNSLRYSIVVFMKSFWTLKISTEMGKVFCSGHKTSFFIAQTKICCTPLEAISSGRGTSPIQPRGKWCQWDKNPKNPTKHTEKIIAPLNLNRFHSRNTQCSAQTLIKSFLTQTVLLIFNITYGSTK